MLAVRSVNIAYGDVHVVYDVDLEVERREIVSLVGSNGAGKTTILRCVSGLLKSLSGEIRFNGTRLDRMHPAMIVKAGVSHVPEGRSLFGSKAVEFNLIMGASRAEVRGRAQINMERVFSLFPVLAERRQQLAGSLSGGEQQMLAIGRGLMSEPDLLILDEPSLGLAPLLVKSILSTIQQIREAGTTILLVEQNLVQALRISDRGYILETGRIVQAGTGAELLQDDMVKRKYLGI